MGGTSLHDREDIKGGLVKSGRSSESDAEGARPPSPDKSLLRPEMLIVPACGKVVS